MIGMADEPAKPAIVFDLISWRWLETIPPRAKRFAQFPVGGEM
jgi:hypothetical protein